MTQKMGWLVAVLALIQEFGSTVPLWLLAVLSVVDETGDSVPASV